MWYLIVSIPDLCRLSFFYIWSVRAKAPTGNILIAGTGKHVQAIVKLIQKDLPIAYLNLVDLCIICQYKNMWVSSTPINSGAISLQVLCGKE